MFIDIKKQWESSTKEKADKITYLKKLHEAICNIKDASNLLEHSIIERLEIDKAGMYITLNEKQNGVKLYINDTDYEEVPMSILCFGNYEEAETKMVLSVLESMDKKEFTVFDVGANVGWYTLQILNHFGEGARVYSFEPSPLTHQRLVNNLHLNKKNGVYAQNIGFYKESGTMEFYYDKEGSGASSLVNIREKSNLGTIEVAMKTMDEWVSEQDITGVDFIKCDVEGSELFVYEGGKETIRKNLPVVFSEMLRKWSAKFGYTPNDIISFMADMGYGCYVITTNDKLAKIDLVDETTVETNYFFLHQEKHKKIIEDLVQ